MYASVVDTCFRAQVAEGGQEVHTPDLPAYINAMWKVEHAERRPLHILYHPGTPHSSPIACTVNTLCLSTKRNRWHTLTLTVPIHDKKTKVPPLAPRTRARPTWRLDPRYYHIARYHLIKTKVPHKPKLKNLQPAEVEKVLGVDTPWLASQALHTPKTLRYFVHL